MTADEIIDIAHKAGTPAITRYGLAVVTMKWMENFAALVAAKEREACAQVCEQMPELEHGWRVTLPSDCAAAIRARGEQP